MIGKLISKSQSTFISSRSMLDEVLVFHELVDFARRRKKELFILKVEFERDFDSVFGDYLFYVLKRMNFGIK